MTLKLWKSVLGIYCKKDNRNRDRNSALVKNFYGIKLKQSMEELISKASQIYVIFCVIALICIAIPSITFAQDNSSENLTGFEENDLIEKETPIFSFYFKEEGGFFPVNNYILLII